MIYFIEAENGLIKIGYTRSPNKRFAGIQADSPFKLKILKITAGDRDKEREIHNLWESFRGQGEWFRKTPELVSFIESLPDCKLRADLPSLVIMPRLKSILVEMGDNIKYARLRRDISAELLSERVGLSRPTLRAAERGDPKVSMGIYAKILFSLGLSEDLRLLAKDDVLGRKLQDVGLIRSRKRSSKKNTH